MSDELSAVIADLKLEPTSVATPSDETGTWLFAFAKFGTRGFLRCLICEDPAKILVHFVLPQWELADAERAAGLYSEHTAIAWTARVYDGGFALVAGLEPTPKWGDALRFGGRLSDFVDSDHTAAMTLATLFKQDAESEQPQIPTKSAFEEIGDDPIVAEPVAAALLDESGCPKFSLKASGDGAHIVFDLGRPSQPGEVQKFATALRRHLRVYADVDVQNASSADQVQLHVHAAEWASFSGPGLLEVIRTSLAPLENMFDHGLSPEAALGLGTPDTVQINERPAQPTRAADEVVFSSVEGTPLRPGAFDDERLREPQSSANLVDVVLRHPGYSDRRVGQVLSILLSIEYFLALRLMQAAPIVIARGVARSHTLTIQEIIEGANGKIQLADPDRYPVS